MLTRMKLNLMSQIMYSQLQLVATTANPAHLIYDIDGYEYDHTYRRYYQSSGWGGGSWQTQNIYAELRRGYYGWYCYTKDGYSSYLSDSDLANKDEIYVVYKKKDNITQGGSH